MSPIGIWTINTRNANMRNIKCQLFCWQCIWIHKNLYIRYFWRLCIWITPNETTKGRCTRRAWTAHYFRKWLRQSMRCFEKFFIDKISFSLRICWSDSISWEKCNLVCTWWVIILKFFWNCKFFPHEWRWSLSCKIWRTTIPIECCKTICFVLFFIINFTCWGIQFFISRIKFELTS